MRAKTMACILYILPRKALGVDEGTVHRDLGAENSARHEEKDEENQGPGSDKSE
jgi:hypothetical protein